MDGLPVNRFKGIRIDQLHVKGTVGDIGDVGHLHDDGNLHGVVLGFKGNRCLVVSRIEIRFDRPEHGIASVSFRFDRLPD